jgi:WD40 repeat protein
MAGGFISLPVMGVRQVVYENGEWGLIRFETGDEALVAPDAPSVKTLACIREDWRENSTFEYTDGEAAFNNEWAVWFVAWPGGEVLGKLRLLGDFPLVKTGSGPGYGEPPVQDFLAVLQMAANSPVLFMGGEDFGGFSQIAFSPDGRIVAAVDRQLQTRLWDLESGKVLKTFEVEFPVPSAFSNVPSFKPLPDKLALSPAADRLAITSIQGDEMQVVDAENGSLLYTLVPDNPVFSPTGELLAVSDPVNKGVVTFEIWLVEPGSGELIGKLENGHNHYVHAMAFSADGRWLASGGFDKKVVVWDVMNRNLAYTYESTSSVESVAISPDGQFVAFMSMDGMQVWQVGTENIVFSLPAEQLNGQALAFSPDGKFLAFSGNESTTTLLDLESKQTFGLIRQVAHAKALFFSPDGGKLYIAESNGIVLAVDYPK